MIRAQLNSFDNAAKKIIWQLLKSTAKSQKTDFALSVNFYYYTDLRILGQLKIQSTDNEVSFFKESDVILILSSKKWPVTCYIFIYILQPILS
jgi:hypothetical protein